MARTYQHWRKVSAMDRPDAWVHKVATNLALSRLRRRRHGRNRHRATLRRNPPRLDDELLGCGPFALAGPALCHRPCASISTGRSTTLPQALGQEARHGDAPSPIKAWSGFGRSCWRRPHERARRTRPRDPTIEPSGSRSRSPRRRSAMARGRQRRRISIASPPRLAALVIARRRRGAAPRLDASRRGRPSDAARTLAVGRERHSRLQPARSPSSAVAKPSARSRSLDCRLRNDASPSRSSRSPR